MPHKGVMAIINQRRTAGTIKVEIMFDLDYIGQGHTCFLWVSLRIVYRYSMFDQPQNFIIEPWHPTFSDYRRCIDLGRLVHPS